MSTTLSGELHGTDYNDNYELTRTADTYDYELDASNGGRVSLKVEAFQPHYPELPNGVKSGWEVIEEKSKVASGAALKGSFTIPRTFNSADSSVDSTLIRVTFAREFLSHKVDYTLTFYAA